ncbi:transposable element Tcb1 transposase [Trichonephila clavipes]|uniref:Transposable element Tcb1 transposase n=1 Tax=Trichonephila clavipes TaxID=2585209 RepID=A0A8X6VST2_TRICX|nr:transposable element Tcb1 transposase [Trichonephila clavipes]
MGVSSQQSKTSHVIEHLVEVIKLAVNRRMGVHNNRRRNRTAIRGFSSGRPRGTTPADDRYIVLQARRNRRQTAGEIARHTTHATGRPISRFTVARRLHGGGLFARRPVRCVPLTPAHRRRRSLWCREHRNWGDNEWGRVLCTDESRFSWLAILIVYSSGESGKAAIIPRTLLKGGAIGLQFLFMDDHAPCHRTVAAEQLLDSEDIEGRRLAARTLPPVTIRELRMALQDEWAAMPQQLIDTLILSMSRHYETCLAVRGDHIPTKDRMILAGHPSQGCFGLQSHCAPCHFFNQASFYPSDFSFSSFRSYYSYGLNVIWKGESVLLTFKQKPEDSLYIPNFDKSIDNSNNIGFVRISRAKNVDKELLETWQPSRILC